MVNRPLGGIRTRAAHASRSIRVTPDDHQGKLIRTKNGFITTRAESEAKRAIRATDTRPEIRLRKELWARGQRYRKNAAFLPGSPDLVFLGKKVAVFVDGDFWHGRNWPKRRERLKRNREYWIRKIEGNIARDKRVDRELEHSGWTIVRLWSTDIMKDASAAAERVEGVLATRK